MHTLTLCVHSHYIPLPLTTMPAGEHHSLALSASGDVFAWGSNAEGQLGNGATGGASAEPVAVAGPASGAADASVAAPVATIAAGARHSVAVSSLGQCLAWGWSLHGQCGTGKAAPSVPAPTVVAALGPLKVVGAAAGMGHTIVCTDQGDAYAWGLNADGQLGDGTDLSSLEVGGAGWGGSSAVVSCSVWAGCACCWTVSA